MAWGVNEDADNVIDLEVTHGRLLNRGDILEKNNVCVIDPISPMEDTTTTDITPTAIPAIVRKERSLLRKRQRKPLLITSEPSTMSLVPYEAVNQDDNGEYVYILRDGKAEKLYVEKSDLSLLCLCPARQHRSGRMFPPW